MKNSIRFLLSALLLHGCAPGVDLLQESATGPEGKADNFYSDVAREYELTGNIMVQMTATEHADPVLRKDKIHRRLTAAGIYLTAYLTAKKGEVFDNMDYGTFGAMVRNYSFAIKNVTMTGAGRYQVEFTVDVAGPTDLLEKIPGQYDPQKEVLEFSMQMPHGSQVDPGDVASLKPAIRSFHPDRHDGPLETITFVARAHDTIKNAYPHFAEFMADDVFDITLFYSHDYTSARVDLRRARHAFKVLRQAMDEDDPVMINSGLGFSSPVTNFDDLKHDSCPLKKTIFANGQQVEVQVRIFHSEMFSGRRGEQHDLALDELARRDVFYYDGHGGPYFGFYLDEQRAATVDTHEFATYPMLAKQQLVVAHACQTYSQYADMLYANSAKDESNLDVVTAVNFDHGENTLYFLRNLITTEGGHHRPMDYYMMINDFNMLMFDDVLYGVVGMEGNPQLHPYADLATLGTQCIKNSQCGDPAGNICHEGQCGIISLAAAACPDGTMFQQLGGSGACLPD